MHLSDALTSDFGPAPECGPSQIRNDVAFGSKADVTLSNRDVAITLEALTLQRPLPNDALKIVASGEKEDDAA